MATRLTAGELRTATEEELEAKLAEAKTELFNLRFQAATGQLESHGRLRAVRKEIARIYTIKRERELGILVEVGEAELAAAAGEPAGLAAAGEPAGLAVAGEPVGPPETAAGTQAREDAQEGEPAAAGAGQAAAGTGQAAAGDTDPAARAEEDDSE
jgi:large subunit ribosomal protein L29